ncbi:hypothetical protein HY404_03050 [Candidatus Microgenomates bacterium]|nr:hypothetical protein [Candidatus Microgenomates bacterium]
MFEYTIHARNKFRRKKIRELRIKAKIVENVVIKPDVIDEDRYPRIAVAAISKNLSLVVVFREVEKGCRIITFFPAERGRYESKILQEG